MISDSDAQFLASVLSEIPLGEPIRDIEFTEKELDNFQSTYGNDSAKELKFNQFFVGTGERICENCGETPAVCGCTGSEKLSVYHLDPESIVSKWCEEVAHLGYYEDLYVEERGPPVWTVKMVSREFGILKFFVVSRTDYLVDMSPDIFEREFVVSLVEGQEVGKQDHYFMWYNLLAEAHHKELHSAIRATLSPLSYGVCDLDSEIAQDNRNAISNNLRKYLSAKGFERVDPQHAIAKIGRTIDFSNIEHASQNDESEAVVVCDCVNSASDIHLHYIKGAEIQPVSDSEIAEAAAQRMRDKVDYRETLDQRTRNITGRTKALALAVATVSLGPVAVALAGFGPIDGAGFDGYPYIPELVISVVLLSVFTVLILPSLQISLFSWDIRGYRTRLREWISSG